MWLPVHKVQTKTSSLYGRVGQRWKVGSSLATHKVQENEAVVPLQVASNSNVRCARAGIKLAQCSQYMNTTSARAGIKLTQCSKYMNTNIENWKLNTLGTVCASEGQQMTHCICSPTMVGGGHQCMISFSLITRVAVNSAEVQG